MGAIVDNWWWLELDLRNIHTLEEKLKSKTIETGNRQVIKFDLDIKKTFLFLTDMGLAGASSCLSV